MQETLGTIAGVSMIFCAALMVVAALYMLCKLMTWHIFAGIKAREEIAIMRDNPRYNEGMRWFAYALYYTVSLTSYITAAVALVTGVMALNYAISKITGSGKD